MFALQLNLVFLNMVKKVGANQFTFKQGAFNNEGFVDRLSKFWKLFCTTMQPSPLSQDVLASAMTNLFNLYNYSLSAPGNKISMLLRFEHSRMMGECSPNENLAKYLFSHYDKNQDNLLVRAC